MNQLTQFTGIATVTEFNGKPILISAGDLDTLKAYLGVQNETGHPDICHVCIAVGPRAEGPAILLDPITTNTSAS